MKYASVCSGVEAASLAWSYLGWEPVWFSEIDPFPCAVLKERFPEVSNLGDMTKIKVENYDNGDQRYTNENGDTVFVPGGVDLLVGGTPCQSFSVAGKREGLEGASGLARTFAELLGAMQPRWVVWENVPGCLSSKSNAGIYDFNFLLAAFAECGYSCGWRILDSQYVRVDGFPRAVPQKRRRVFVVGHLGKQWEYPAKVLFEQQSLLGNTPPCRIEGKGFTADVERSIGTASTVRMRSGCDRACKGSVVTPNGKDCADTIDASYYKGVGSRNGNERTVVCLNDQGGSVMAVEENGNAGTLRSNAGDNQTAVAIAENTNGRSVETGGNGVGAQEELAYTQNATGVMGVANNATVRRLLPVECERLMGFPDNHTRIVWKGKSPEECPDAPRYKACGNSMCVNVMRWIGMRIEKAEQKLLAAKYRPEGESK